MKYLFALSLVAALCFLGVSCNEETAEKSGTEEAPTTETKDKVCEPGSVSQVQCNTCICNSEGSELACTKKRCVEGQTEGEVNPENLPATDGEEVKPQNLPVPEEEVKPQNLPVPEEEVKAENLPVPEADLKKVETEVPAVAKDRRRRRRRDDDDACEPGKNFKKECNDCECPASGKKSEAQICTTIAC